MTFTIPAFWCGVLATVIGEIIALIIAAAVRSRSKSKYTFKK